MEVAPSSIPAPTPYQVGLIHQKLSGRWPLLRLVFDDENIKSLYFSLLGVVAAVVEKLKGRLLIIIMRPAASLTRCYTQIQSGENFRSGAPCQ